MIKNFLYSEFIRFITPREPIPKWYLDTWFWTFFSMGFLLIGSWSRLMIPNNNPDYVLFSNDGSLGYMSSTHMRNATPGDSTWNDLYWLGEPNVQFPISFTYIFLWACNHPLPSGLFCWSLVCLKMFGVPWLDKQCLKLYRKYGPR